MMAVWHPSLPQFSERNFEDGREDAVWEFQTDSGRGLAGLKTTDSFEIIDAAYRFTWAQRDVFDAFFETTIRRGIDPFLFPHPVSREQHLVEFIRRSRPAFKFVVHDLYEARLRLRILP